MVLSVFRFTVFSGVTTMYNVLESGFELNIGKCSIKG